MGFNYEYAEAWVPQEGDVLEGEIVSIDTSPPGQFGVYPIVTIKREDGELRALHAFHDTVRNALSHARPTVGENIGVKYLGQQQPRNSDGFPYHNYRVQVAGRGGFDWERQSAPEPGTRQEPEPDF